jgi:uncharacterized RDD family membrane protein YckC
MSADPGRVGVSPEMRPHAYDPLANPELFQGVLTARVLAFIIDVIVLAVPVALVSIFIFVSGFLTFGLGWLLFWPLNGAAIVWAVLYYGFTLGGPHSATLGMRAMGIEMRTWYGAPCYFVLGAVSAIVYWISVSMLTPFVLLVGLFNPRRRLLHDMLRGTVVINSPARAARLSSRR